jgi:hypothetical protein
MPDNAPVLLSGGNPQIAKGYGDAPVQAYIAAMPGWKAGAWRRLDKLIGRTVPGAAKAAGRRADTLVPEHPLLRQIYQGRLLSRRLAEARAAGRVEKRRHALFPYP